MQPGVVGMALAQGIILGVMLCLTVGGSGGYLNPGITIMLWVFNRLSSARTAWLLGGQLVGAILAGLCLSRTFADDILRSSRMGTPHLDTQVFLVLDRGTLLAGTAIELLLTFFLVLTIFGMSREGGKDRFELLLGGGVLVAGGIFAFPLTGAAANPARWFGTVLWEYRLQIPQANPMGDVFVYVAGPILGAMLAGFLAFKMFFFPNSQS
jgi:glycerol uptake facilitator-like aquaporin